MKQIIDIYRDLRMFVLVGMIALAIVLLLCEPMTVKALVATKCVGIALFVCIWLLVRKMNRERRFEALKKLMREE